MVGSLLFAGNVLILKTLFLKSCNENKMLTQDIKIQSTVFRMLFIRT